MKRKIKINYEIKNPRAKRRLDFGSEVSNNKDKINEEYIVSLITRIEEKLREIESKKIYEINEELDHIKDKISILREFLQLIKLSLDLKNKIDDGSEKSLQKLNNYIQENKDKIYQINLDIEAKLKKIVNLEIYEKKVIADIASSIEEVTNFFASYKITEKKISQGKAVKITELQNILINGSNSSAQLNIPEVTILKDEETEELEEKSRSENLEVLRSSLSEESSLNKSGNIRNNTPSDNIEYSDIYQLDNKIISRVKKIDLENSEDIVSEAENISNSISKIYKNSKNTCLNKFI